MDRPPTLVSVVREDLMHLGAKWDRTVSQEQLRREADVLRRLVVQDNFGKAWRESGFPKEPLVRAADLAEGLQGVSLVQVIVAQTGGTPGLSRSDPSGMYS